MTDPGGGSGCGDVAVSQSYTSGYVNISFQTYCSFDVYGMEHNFTGQRNGTAVITKSAQYCRSASNTLRNCTKTISIPDPAGTQKFQALDEWFVWQNPYTNRTIASGKTFSNVFYH
ncbi:hypothetical protein ACXR8F_03610 [Terrabacter sp. AAH1]